MTPTFTAALLTTAKRQKHHNYSLTDKWISKTWSVHTTEYYHSALNRKEILAPATTWMNPEDIMLSEISQTHRDKSYRIPLV